VIKKEKQIDCRTAHTNTLNRYDTENECVRKTN